jgi:hypothetical protein
VGRRGAEEADAPVEEVQGREAGALAGGRAT